MDTETFKRLVERAKKEPEFFHSLVFSPEKVLAEVDVPRRAKGALISLSPAEAIAKLVGVVAACGNTCTSSCDNTCGQSCGFTTNFQGQLERVAAVSYFSRFNDEVAGCGNTCTSSCDNTCGQSCGFTTNFQGRFGWQEAVR